VVLFVQAELEVVSLMRMELSVSMRVEYISSFEQSKEASISGRGGNRSMEHDGEVKSRAPMMLMQSG